MLARRCCEALSVGLLLIAGLAQPAAAAGATQCFAPEALTSHAEERTVVKGDHRFDRPAPPRELPAAEPVPLGLRGAIRRVVLPPGRKLIALTFDLCEQPGEVAGYDGEIFEFLRREGVKATFFAGGKWMRSHAARAQQIMTDPLFEVGNHSEAHRNLRLLQGVALEDEIMAPQRAYATLADDLVTRQCHVPARIGLFRFPYGACNPEALAAVNDHGLLAIQWDLSTGDPAPGQSGQAIAEAMMHAKPGSIIIAHANGRGHHTREALPIAIPALKAKGFRFVTVSELLAAGKPEVVQTCYDTHPGDTDRYDHVTAALHPKKAEDAK